MKCGKCRAEYALQAGSYGLNTWCRECLQYTAHLPLPDFTIRTTEATQQFTSGAIRGSSKGKGRFDLIPPGPVRRVAQQYERGAEYYGDNNWRKGIPNERFLESLLRHVNDYQRGDRIEDHMAAVVFNAFGIMFNDDRGKEQVATEPVAENRGPGARDAIADTGPAKA